MKGYPCQVRIFIRTPEHGTAGYTMRWKEHYFPSVRSAKLFINELGLSKRDYQLFVLIGYEE